MLPSLVLFTLITSVSSYQFIPRNYHRLDSQTNPYRENTLKLYSEILPANEPTPQDQILRRVDKWACVKNCGACCKLGPATSRPYLTEFLSPDEIKQYLSLIGSDNWCIHFDKEKRMCKQYDTRPDFCRVVPRRYNKKLGIPYSQMNEYFASCCVDNIADVYGEESIEMERFEDVLASLST